jgi:hypothetical protein
LFAVIVPEESGVVVLVKNWRVVPVPLVGTLLPSQLAELLQAEVPPVVVPVHT